jgi:hypothetical protein
MGDVARRRTAGDPFAVYIQNEAVVGGYAHNEDFRPRPEREISAEVQHHGVFRRVLFGMVDPAGG